MPFDAEQTTENRVKVYLQRTRDYIEKHGWCQRVAEDNHGRVCVMGALHKIMVMAECTDADGNAAVEALGFTDPHDPNYSTAPYWNDAPGRTQAEVLARFDEAIARLSNGAV